MNQPTHVMKNWRHYWDIANNREDLREFKSLLEVHYNKPDIAIYSAKVNTKDGVKTVNELLHELKPKE
jgi:hypothetical protein